MLPLHNPWRLIQGLAVIVVLLAVYLPTVPDSIVWGDSGELATACFRLGVAHPPGYPLYTMLGYLWTRLVPVGEPGYRLNLLSAVCAVASAGVLWAVCLRLLEQIGVGVVSDRPAAAAAAVLTAAVAPLFWAQAVVCEVYAPLVLLIALALFLVPGKTDVGRWFWFALTLSTAVVHHRLALALLPGLLVLVPWTSLRQWAVCARLATGGMLGLAPVLYLPLRATARPVLNWGDPSNAERLLAHLAGVQYADQFHPSLRLLPHAMLTVMLEALQQYTWTVVLIVGGAIVLWRRSRRKGVAVLLLAFVPLWVAASYRVADQWVFFLPGMVLLSLPMAVGLAGLLEIARRGGPARVVRWVWMLAALAPATGLVLHAPVQWRARTATATSYAKTMLAAVPPGGVVLTGLWYWHADNEFGALFYARHVLNLRPDVDVVGANFLRYEWYVRQVHPLGIRWNATGRLMSADEYFLRLQTGVIDPLRAVRPVCVTQDFRQLHGKLFLGHPISVPESLRHYPCALLAEATPDVAGVDPRLRAFIPDGRLYQVLEPPL